MSRRKDPKKAFADVVTQWAADQGMNPGIPEFGDIWENQGVRQIFLGEGWEILTDELIGELGREQGWKKEDLEKFRREGGYYCRPRNSIVFPPAVIPHLD